MRFIGIDLSKRCTGFIVLDDTGAIVTAERIGWADNCGTLHQRIRYFMRVAMDICGKITTARAAGHNAHFAIEGYSMNADFGVNEAGELGGIVRQTLVVHETVHEIAPTALKKFATGSGAAKKEQVMLEVFKRWGYSAPDNNCADAYALARFARALHLGDDTLTAVQRECLENFRNPKPKIKKAKKQ